MPCPSKAIDELPKLPKSSSQTFLRTQLKLLGLPPVFRRSKQEPQIVMSVPDMQALYEKEQQRRLGLKNIQQMYHDRADSLKCSDGEIAYAFWFHADVFPLVCEHGLSSAAKVFRKVFLITYPDQHQYPSCVEIVSAEQFLSQADFLRLLNAGISVCLLSDYIRLAAMRFSCS
jgi:hypothetical protein